MFVLDAGNMAYALFDGLLRVELPGGAALGMGDESKAVLGGAFHVLQNPLIL